MHLNCTVVIALQCRMQKLAFFMASTVPPHKIVGDTEILPICVSVQLTVTNVSLKIFLSLIKAVTYCSFLNRIILIKHHFNGTSTSYKTKSKLVFHQIITKCKESDSFPTKQRIIWAAFLFTGY